MKSTQERILRTLLAYPGSTINDLAQAVGINGISIRHHLTALEASDLVTSAEERHGVGRPRLIYTLTDKGVEEFPTNYLRLTKRLIEFLKDKMSSEEVREIFSGLGEEIAQSYIPGLNDKSLEERIKILKTMLTKEGFIIEWQKNEESYTLKSLSCPYYQIGFEHPEICAFDHTLISSLLSAPITEEACILNGDDHCTFQISIKSK